MTLSIYVYLFRIMGLWRTYIYCIIVVMCLVYMYSNPPVICGENPPIKSNPVYMCFGGFISRVCY
jgi:hypothetical protein